ncbi:MAG: hypothetical protein RR065_09885 [Clostridia bacterium]
MLHASNHPLQTTDRCILLRGQYGTGSKKLFAYERDDIFGWDHMGKIVLAKAQVNERGGALALRPYSQTLAFVKINVI